MTDRAGEAARRQGEVAQEHADEAGHETFLMEGFGWACRTCDEDWRDLLLEFANGDPHLGRQPGWGGVTEYRPRRTGRWTVTGQFDGPLDMDPDEEQDLRAALLAQFEDRGLDGWWITLIEPQPPAGAEEDKRLGLSAWPLVEALGQVGRLIEATLSMNVGRAPTCMRVGKGGVVETDVGHMGLTSFRRFYATRNEPEPHRPWIVERRAQ